MLPIRTGPERRKARANAQAKNTHPKRNCMFSANDSWLSNVPSPAGLLTWRSLLCAVFPDKESSDVSGASLPPYSDEFVQDLHLLPFSPGR